MTTRQEFSQKLEGLKNKIDSLKTSADFSSESSMLDEIEADVDEIASQVNGGDSAAMPPTDVPPAEVLPTV